MTAKQDPTAEPRRKGLRVRLGMLLAGMLVIGVCLAARHYWGATPAEAGPASSESLPAAPAAPSQAAAPVSPQDRGAKVMATVNNEPITRGELAQECLRHYGKQVLESALNKYLIAQECRRRNIVITQGDVDKEIERMSSKFALPVDTWLKMLKDERGINPTQYAADIIWPTLALKRLAGDQLQVAPQEVAEEFERQYGEAVKVRIIVLADARTAEAVRAEAVARPNDFGGLAKEKSVDVNSASLKGLIPPIRHHMGDKKVEEMAFQMKDGDISPVVQVADQYIVLKRECLLPASQMQLGQAKDRLEELIRDRKMRQVSHDIFQRLQEAAKVENILNDPARRQQQPGIAAIINGHEVSMAELAEMCVQRHGEEVLEGTINRRLIEQAVRKANLTITDADLDAEIARAAALKVRPRDARGTPDVDTWLKMVQHQGVSLDIYRRDAVWPTVALRKLAGGAVKVADEDLQRGYDANYGPRVRCRAIVLNNLRRAQQVWEMARARPTVEFFGDLAEKFSIEPGSQALRGEVPPIQKNGGQPLLEKEAFALEAGQLSGIIDAGGGHYAILFCEGKTEPVKIEFAQVRDLIYEDILEKKTRLAMGDYFERLQQTAMIDNYLAGTSRAPTPKKDQQTERPSTTTERRAGSVLQR